MNEGEHVPCCHAYVRGAAASGADSGKSGPAQAINHELESIQDQSLILEEPAIPLLQP